MNENLKPRFKPGIILIYFFTDRFQTDWGTEISWDQKFKKLYDPLNQWINNFVYWKYWFDLV